MQGRFPCCENLRRVAGTCFWVLAFFVSLPVAAADTFAEQFRRAYELRTANHAQFLEILQALDDERAQMTARERMYLRYLHAYQLSYEGDYRAAAPELDALIRDSDDVSLRFRAGITLTNILALSAHYDEAYTRLNELTELQPQISDRQDRLLALGIAALLYNEAGQYDLALANVAKWQQEDPLGVDACKQHYLEVGALYKSGRLRSGDSALANGIEACEKIGDPVYANLIRTFAANLAVDQDRYTEAIKLLEENYQAAQHTQYARLTSEIDSIIARAEFKRGDLARARQFALDAVRKSVRNDITKPLVDAYQVLYEVAEKEQDFRAALDYHERFAAADKGYLNDTTARALAYQMISQQLIDKKRQVDVLRERNQMLQLQQQITEKSQETQRLYILLLLLVIAFTVLWTYRIKRSQMRFQRLSRRDGLTGIVNRQHFMDEAKLALNACARSEREACLILVDLDNFKNVNDTHGHVAGDGVLKQTVEMCQLHMRAVDLFGRLGGEEFGVLLQDCALEVGPRSCAARLRASPTLVSR
jgi:GGDEF domain-containing protein